MLYRRIESQRLAFQFGIHGTVCYWGRWQRGSGQRGTKY